MASGTFTPVLTNTANINASTAFECQYMIVDNVVTVSGYVNITPAADNTETKLDMSLPVSSDFSVEQQCAGTAIAGETFGANPQNGGMILGSPATNTAQLIFKSNVTVSHRFVFTYTYLIKPEPTQLPTLSVANGIATASYGPLANERNKPPVITNLIISMNGPLTTGTVLTATITGEANGPFAAAAHEYQWYRASISQGGSLTPIFGATGSEYTIQGDDGNKYLVCAARFVQAGGSNNKSSQFFSEMTDLVGSGGGADINVDWADFFDIESGASVPDNWNDAGVSPQLLNFGSDPDWIADAASKPIFNVNKLVFDKASVNRILPTYNNVDYPPVFELWVKGKFLQSGAIVADGNQIQLGLNSSTQFISFGLANQPGDLNEHVFRVRLNGATSIFQVDGGPEISFDESATFANQMVLGSRLSGADPVSFELKRFQRTPDGVLLTNQQRDDKWAFHGF